MRLVLATQNPGKLKEIKTLAQEMNDLTWLTLELAPEKFNPDENGSTFAENALIKATAAARLTHAYALADDSGIAVDVLEGKPGVYSARYSEGDEHRGCLKLIEDLKNVPLAQRAAAYHCVMALVSPEGKLLHQAEGIWHGRIIDKMRGTGGFGYDPIFYLDSHGKTAAEISLAEKNRISHRAQAWLNIKEFLIDHYSNRKSS